MENKSKILWLVVVVVALAFAGFLWYQNSPEVQKLGGLNSQKSDEEIAEEEAEMEAAVDDTVGDAGELDDIDINSICENGEWVKIEEMSGTLASASGKVRMVVPGDDYPDEMRNYLYYLEGTPNVGLSGNKVENVAYFEGREVEVKGLSGNGGKEIKVSEIRCAGAETNKDLITERKKVLDYISANINTLAPKKAPRDKWLADIVDFVDMTHVYVEYYDIAEDDEENPLEEDTSRRLLLELKTDGGYSATAVAYWEMGEDDYVLKTGQDKYEEEDVIEYVYDYETQIWERVD